MSSDLSSVINLGNPSAATLALLADEFLGISRRYVQRMRILPVQDHDFDQSPQMAERVARELLEYSSNYPEESEPFRMFTQESGEFLVRPEEFFYKIEDRAKKGRRFDIILDKPPKGEFLEMWKRVNSLNGVSVRMKPQYDERLYHLLLIGDSYKAEAHHEDLSGKRFGLFDKRSPFRYGFHDPSFVQGVLLPHWINSIDTPGVLQLK